MTKPFRALMAAGAMLAVLVSASPAGALPPLSVPPEASSTLSEPANGLLCGRGWHWSYFYFKCERNRHRCPNGKHWISLLRVCV